MPFYFSYFTEWAETESLNVVTLRKGLQAQNLIHNGLDFRICHVINP